MAPQVGRSTLCRGSYTSSSSGAAWYTPGSSSKVWYVCCVAMALISFLSLVKGASALAHISGAPVKTTSCKTVAALATVMVH